MNKVLIGFNVVLAAAVVYLFFKKPGKPGETETENKTEVKSTAPSTNKAFSSAKSDGQLRVAFINSDSLSSQYLLFKEAETELTTLSEQIGKELQAKEASLMATGQRLQKDFELKTKSEQEAAMRQMQSMEAGYNKFKEEKMAILDRVRNENLMKAETALKKFLDTYCEANKIDYVMREGSTGSIFYGNKVFDITNDVAIGLNAEYNKK